MPTSWLRSFLIDVERPPRKDEELHDVVRWRLKKLLPVAPTDLRLSIVRLPEIDGQKRLLVMAGIERAMHAIESAFGSIGVEVGLITTRLFALVPRGAGVVRPALVVQHEESFLSLLLLTDGVPRLLRTKPLALADQSDALVEACEITLLCRQQDAALPVEFQLGRKSDHQTPHGLGLGIESRQPRQRALHVAPVALGKQPQTLFTGHRIDGHHHARRAALRQRLTVPGRDRETPFGVEIECTDPRKHGFAVSFLGWAIPP